MVSVFVLCSVMGCGSGGDDQSPANTAGAGGTTGAEDYQGSCDRTTADDMCTDNYCAGSDCATYLQDAKTSCKGTWSDTKCAASLFGKCSMVSVGWTATTNYYEGPAADVESACTAFGGTFSP